MIARLYLWACICAIWILQTAIFVVSLGATGRFAWALISRFVL